MRTRLALGLGIGLLVGACGKDPPPPPARESKDADLSNAKLEVHFRMPTAFTHHDTVDGLEAGDGRLERVRFALITAPAGETARDVAARTARRTDEHEVIRAVAEVAPGRFGWVTKWGRRGCHDVEVWWTVVSPKVAGCAAMTCEGRWQELLDLCIDATVYLQPIP